MNNKESVLYLILDKVVQCCATQIDDEGTMSLSGSDVIGKSRSENVVMTRSIFVHQVVAAGYSTTTIAQFLKRTTHAVRHLLELGNQFLTTSRAYRIAYAEATLQCKDITSE